MENSLLPMFSKTFADLKIGDKIYEVTKGDYSNNYVPTIQTITIKSLIMEEEHIAINYHKNSYGDKYSAVDIPLDKINLSKIKVKEAIFVLNADSLTDELRLFTNNIITEKTAKINELLSEIENLKKNYFDYGNKEIELIKEKR